MKEPKYINNNHYSMLCANYTCKHCKSDRCTAPTLNGVVPYELRGSVKDSEDNCKQYADKGSPFFRR